tara:strand:+ start:145 stop:420 length:276 start_codon:yes stop_codon:yes gene_type:complete
MDLLTSLANKTTSGTKPMNNYIINEKSKEVMIKNDVPEKLHKIVIGIIICITTDIDRKYDKAKSIVESESVNLSDLDITTAQNKALDILYS